MPDPGHSGLRRTIGRGNRLARPTKVTGQQHRTELAREGSHTRSGAQTRLQEIAEPVITLRPKQISDDPDLRGFAERLSPAGMASIVVRDSGNRSDFGVLVGLALRL